MSSLHPEVVRLLEAQRQSGARPRSALTIEETRAAMRAGRSWQQPPPPGVPVRDSLAGTIPVRLYGRSDAPVGLLYLHGGRFFSGDLESHDWPLQTLAAAVPDCLICAVDYRLAPVFRHPAAVEDAISTGAWLAPQVSTLLLAGDSAGGYLAAMAALALRPAHQFLVYPMLDPRCDTPSYRTFFTGPWPSGEDMKRGWDLYGGEPLTGVEGAFPPTFLAVAGVDALRDEALLFAAALERRSIPVETVDFSDMHHGFFTQTVLTRSRELITLLASRINAVAIAGKKV